MGDIKHFKIDERMSQIEICDGRLAVANLEAGTLALLIEFDAKKCSSSIACFVYRDRKKSSNARRWKPGDSKRKNAAVAGAVAYIDYRRAMLDGANDADGKPRWLSEIAVNDDNPINSFANLTSRNRKQKGAKKRPVPEGVHDKQSTKKRDVALQDLLTLLDIDSITDLLSRYPRIKGGLRHFPAKPANDPTSNAPLRCKIFVRDSSGKAWIPPSPHSIRGLGAIYREFDEDYPFIVDQPALARKDLGGRLIFIGSSERRDWPWPATPEFGERRPADAPIYDRRLLVDAIIGDLTSADQKARLVVLHGPPGVGKTAVIKEVVLKLLDTFHVAETQGSLGLGVTIPADLPAPLAPIFEALAETQTSFLKTVKVMQEHVSSYRKSALTATDLPKKAIVFDPLPAKVVCLRRRPEAEEEYERYLSGSAKLGDVRLEQLFDRYGFDPQLLSLSSSRRDTSKGRVLLIIDDWTDSLESLMDATDLSNCNLLVATARREPTSPQRRETLRTVTSYPIQGHPFITASSARSMLLKEAAALAAAITSDDPELKKLQPKLDIYAKLVRSTPLALLSSSARLEGASVETVEGKLDALITDAKRTPLERSLPLPQKTGYRYRLRALLYAMGSIAKTDFIHTDEPPEPAATPSHAALFLATCGWLVPASYGTVPFDSVANASCQFDRMDSFERRISASELESVLVRNSIVDFISGRSEARQVEVLPYVARELLWVAALRKKRVCNFSDKEDQQTALINLSVARAFDAVLPNDSRDAGHWPHFLQIEKQWPANSGVVASEFLVNSVCRAQWKFHANIVRKMAQLSRRLISYHCHLAENERPNTDEREKSLLKAEKIGRDHEQFVRDQAREWGDQRANRFLAEAALNQMFPQLLRHRLAKDSDAGRPYILAAYQFSTRGCVVPKIPEESAEDLRLKWHALNARRWSVVVGEKLFGDSGQSSGLMESLFAEMKLVTKERDELTDSIAALGIETAKERWRDLCVKCLLPKTKHAFPNLASEVRRAAEQALMLGKSDPGKVTFDQRLLLAIGASVFGVEGEDDPFWKTAEMHREITELSQASHFTIFGNINDIVEKGLMLGRVRHIWEKQARLKLEG